MDPTPRADLVRLSELDSASPGPGSRGTFPSWATPALVAALTFLAYAATLRFGFVYDDRVQIVANPWLASWRFVSRYFTENAAAFIGSPGGAIWRPLFLVWLFVNRSIFDLAPWGWHLTTMALHCLSAVLVYFLSGGLLRDRLLAGFAALLFGLWPTTVETAAWISGATDSLLCIFLSGSVLLYLRSQEGASRLWSGLSLLIYALALLAKETAVILPALIAIYAWFYGRDSLREQSAAAKLRGTGRAVAPYLAVTAVYFAVRALVLAGTEPAPLLTGTAAMAMTWPAAIWFYLRLLFFPNAVSPHYNLKVITDFSVGAVLLPAVVLVGVALAVWFALRRASSETHRRVSLALAWMLTPLVPVLYLRPLAPDDFAHIRYLYLPTIGLVLLVAPAVSSLTTSTARLFKRPAAQAVPALVLLGLCAFGTAREQIHWASNYSLFAHAVEVAPGNPRALTNFAVELGERQRYRDAVELFERALRINPRLWYAAMDLGYTFFRMGQYESAERWISHAIEISPTDPEQYTYLAAVEIKLGRLDRAEEALRAAVKRAPSCPGYQYGLGLVLEREGKRDQAIQAYRNELANDPGNERARTRLKELEGAR